MKKIIPLIIALSLAGIGGASAQSTIFKTINSAEMNLGWITAFELPANGGGWYDGFPSPIGELNAVYPSSDTVVFSPNTTSNPSSVWYTPSGQLGAAGNKIVESLLLAQADGTLSGTLQFEGVISDFSLSTNAAGLSYSLRAVVRDWAPDYSTFVETILPLTSTGSFAVTQALDPGAGRHVQWGLIMQGPNIWPGNTEELANAGSVTVEAIPEPSTYALLGLAAAGGLLVRRFRRKA
jgi:hypothetical protein